MASSQRPNGRGGGYRNQNWTEKVPNRMEGGSGGGSSGGPVTGQGFNQNAGKWQTPSSEAGINASGSSTAGGSEGPLRYAPPIQRGGENNRWTPRSAPGGEPPASQGPQANHRGKQVQPYHEYTNSTRPRQQRQKNVQGLFAQTRIRATFYPKFENEKSDREIRMKMMEVVSAGKGVLEVTLKHSGSLFMYAGESGAFAKNSFGNLYTAVGVFVLGRTFQEAWGSQAPQKQREFNLYLQNNRICISMELVTAVLGDHGQRPLQDYVVITAVADLAGKPRFYSTPDLVSFCRKWRLPTNHMWLFSTRKSIAAFFAAFDALCEEGTATSVSNVLDEVADVSVPATKSHMEFQGEILEGLVARVVSPRSAECLQTILQQFPVLTCQGQVKLGPSLREICAANKASEDKQIMALLKNTGKDMCSDWSDWTYREGGRGGQLFNKLVHATPVDFNTSKLQEMLHHLNERGYRARYPCHLKRSVEDDDKIHFKLTIHVLDDIVFRRYHKDMRYNPEMWPLYRGFFVDVSLFDWEQQAQAANGIESLGGQMNKLNLKGTEDDNLADDASNLMLKLKFLTYKIRTFLIRNGLSILFKDGFPAYRKYYMRQMEIWNTSPDKRRHLDEMLNEWAAYITRKYSGGKRFPDSMYLSEAEPFLEQYARRNARNQGLVGSAGSLVRTEDFLAGVAADDNEHVPNNPSLQSSTELAEHSGASVRMKPKGMLVFFPGIPGCAKSSLCKELLKPGILGDSRPVHSLMGDMIKGRYWPKLADERRKRPEAITLADKNAPNQEVWHMIEEICQSTSAVGVPVVPDSEGTSFNPFSLEALAVFIYRILQRSNHPGNLDKNTPNMGYILLMFYNLYKGKDRMDFEAVFKSRFGNLVKMPLLKANRPPMPSVITDVLEEGLDLYGQHTAKHGKLESYKGSLKDEWVRWEAKLRQTISSFANHLISIQVPFNEVLESVKKQLVCIAKGDYNLSAPTKEVQNFQTIVYAALSISPDEIITLLKKVKLSSESARSFFSDKDLENTLKECHVTLAHKRSHGVAAVASFSSLKGTRVDVQLMALFFSEKLCALEARIGSSDISSKNEWPHVTVWTAPGVPPKEASTLPQLFLNGQARKIQFQAPHTVTGVVNLM